MINFNKNIKIKGEKSRENNQKNKRKGNRKC